MDSTQYQVNKIKQKGQDLTLKKVKKEIKDSMASALILEKHLMAIEGFLHYEQIFSNRIIIVFCYLTFEIKCNTQI